MQSGGRGRRVQVRAARADGWTAAKRRVFLDHLATTCNARLSAQAAGMGEHSAYALRRRDAEFSAQWEAAIQLGYSAVEAALLARALRKDNAVLPEREDGDPLPPSPAEMDPELGERLLRIYGQRGSGAGKRIGPRPRVALKAELVATLNRRIANMKRARKDKG